MKRHLTPMCAKNIKFWMALSFILPILLVGASLTKGQSTADPSSRVAELRIAVATRRNADILNIAHALQGDCASGFLSCPSLLCSELHNSIARAHLALDRPDSCIYHIAQSLKYLHIDTCADRILYASGYLLRAEARARMGDLRASRKDLEFVVQHFGDDPKVLSEAQVNLGNICILQENYAQARQYLLSAKELATEVYGPSHPVVGKCLNNLAYIESEFKNWEKAIAYALQSLTIKEAVYGPEHPALLTTLVNLPSYLIHLGKYEEAITISLRVEDLCIQNYGHNSLQLRPILVNLANYYLLAGNRAAAIDCMERCLAIHRLAFDPSDPSATKIYLQAAEFYMDLGLMPKAQGFLQFVAANLHYDPKSPFAFQAIENQYDYAEFLACQQKYYRLDAAQNPSALDSLEQSLYLAMAFFEWWMLQPASSDDRAAYTTLAFPLFEAALNHLYDRDAQGNLPRMFEIIERSKSRLLREAIKQSQVVGFSGVPDSVLGQEAALDQRITDLETERYLLGTTSVPSTRNAQVVQNASALLAANKEKLAWIEMLHRQYPRYHQLRYQSQVASLSALKAALPPKTTLIEYFEGDTTLFVIIVSADAAQILRRPKDQQLASLVADLRAGLLGHGAVADRVGNRYQAYSQQYCTAAYTLYQQLLAPFQDVLQPHLIIVPDGVLHYLPFDALLTAPPADPTDFRNHAYLIRKHAVSYQNAASIYLQSHPATPPNKQQKVLAVAPKFSAASDADLRIDNARSALGPLLNNLGEASEVQAIWDGDLLQGDAASLSQFQTMATDYGIIHLATHAKSEDQEGNFSYIAFTSPDGEETGKLYAQDLFGWQLSADLVVLSACETGLGELRRGEGMISLSRAFTYAGARSTVMSLWAVDDLKTKDLMADFHQALKKGMPKDEALRAAKLKYITSAANPHPYYWAEFVAVGDMAPIGSTNPAFLWLVLIVIGVAVLLLGSKLW
jgi:CHAT domain-containing protein